MFLLVSLLFYFLIFSNLNLVCVIAALFKTTTANDITVPTNFIIYDSGSGGTSAALIKIDPKKTIDGLTAKSMEILGIESDSGLGGDLIDDRIASFLTAKFEALHPGIKVTSGKPRNKVLIEANRIKKILNANDRATVTLEDLVEDYGMNIPISREDIDNLLMDLASRFSDPITNLLSKSKKSLDDISAILMIGGNSRHQFLLKTLKSQVGPEKISFTLDPDESIVKGATLYGAKLHPSFRLRPTHFMDISPSGLYLQYREILDGHVEGEMKRVELFPEVSVLQSRKSLTLKKINNVVVDFFYSKNNQKIGSVSVNGFNEVVDKVASSGKHIIGSKMRIPVLLSSSGHVVFESPVAAIDFEDTVSKKVYKTHTKAATTTESAPNTETTTSTANDDGGATPTITPTPTPVENAPRPEISVETQTVQEKVKRSKNYDLMHEIRFEMPPMNDEAIIKSQKAISAAREKEFEKTRVANARNDLEKAVYRVQGELNSSDFLAYAGNSERSAAKNQLSIISKFLAEEHNDNATADIYLNHLNELVKIEIAVKKRQHEEEERPAAIEALQLILTSAEEFLRTQNSITPDQRPQTDEELKALTKKSQEISKWLKEKTKKQDNSAKNIDPVLSISELEAKKSELNDQILILMAKKMPIPIKTEEPESKENEPEKAEDPEKTEHDEDGKTEESSDKPEAEKLPEDLVEEHEHFEL